MDRFKGLREKVITPTVTLERPRSRYARIIKVSPKNCLSQAVNHNVKFLCESRN